MASYSPARTRESVLVGYALLDHARTLGIEPDLLGPDAVVIDGQDIPRPGAALPFGSVAHMAETMARLVGDAHVSLRLGSYPHPFDFGLAGYHAAAAENAESFVGRCYDLVATVSTVFEYRLTFGPKRGEFVLRPRFRSAGLRHLAEINLVCFWQGMSRFVEPDFEPFEVRFAHGAKEGGTHYRNLFQCRALFDQPDYALCFDPRVGDCRPLTADPQLRAALDPYIEQEDRVFLENMRLRWGQRVEAEILRRLGDDVPTMDEVADSLQLPPRRLQLRLAQEQTSFRDLLDRARRFKACASVIHGQPSHQIAQALGYRELASFYRAFRRWTGSTPSAFRTVRARVGL